MESQHKGWGTVHSLGTTKCRPAIQIFRDDCSASAWLWKPQADLMSELPEDIGMAIVCCENADLRIFLPIDTASSESDIKRLWRSLQHDPKALAALGPQRNALDPFRSFLFYAWTVGYSITRRQSPERFHPEEEPTPEMMWYLFQRALELRAFAHRKFDRVLNLVVKEPTGKGMRNAALLPWQISNTTADLGYPQSVRELLQLGCREAIKAGIVTPTPAQQVRFALATIALRFPMPQSTAAKSAKIVESVLFVVDGELDLNDEVAREIEGKIFQAIRHRIESRDESQNDFNNWFGTKHGTLVKQIAQQIKSMPYVDAKDAVTCVFQKLGFKAFVSVGECIAAAMRDFADGLPQPLTELERTCFEQLYFPQANFGGLPLILFRDTLEFAEGLLWKLLTIPTDENAVGAFHNLLSMYGQLLGPRREADREAKRLQRFGPVLEFDAGRDSKPGSNELDLVIAKDMLKTAVDYVRKTRGLRCKCDSVAWKVTQVEQSAKTIHIGFACPTCECSIGPVEISTAELRRRLDTDLPSVE